MKLDNGNKRKLSKRKDNEAAISFFLQDGYPIEAIKEYLYTIANSNYEEWHMENKGASQDEFVFTFEKMSLDGALFDLEKLQNISKEVLSTYSGERMLEEMLKYTEKYDKNFFELISANKDYFAQIMSIEKDKENPRKDYIKYSDVFNKVKFFYEPYYSNMMTEQELPFNPNMDRELIKTILNEFVQTLDYEVSEQEWFNSLKELASRHGFAENAKVYKKNKEAYKGHVGDVAEMVRIALTSSKQSPNIYYVLRILKMDEIKSRIQKTIDLIK